MCASKSDYKGPQETLENNDIDCSDNFTGVKPCGETYNILYFKLFLSKAV